MIIITNISDNAIMQLANDTTDKPSPNEAVTKNGDSNLGTWSNGYPVLIEENTAFPPEPINIHQNVEVSDEVKSNPSKYCYTPEQGFYENPNYVEPDPANTYGISDELFNQIKSDYREQIAQEVSENGYNA